MTQVTIHERKKHLPEPIQRALAGEEIIIANGQEPLVRLVALSKEHPQRRSGNAKGVILYMADDFDDPLNFPTRSWRLLRTARCNPR